MSADSPAAPAAPALPLSRGNFAIVASRYNAEFSDALVESAETELRRLVGRVSIACHRVPGAFEIPLLVREALLDEKVDAVIALGVILRGATAHADHIGHAVTHSLARLMLEHGKPVIHEVLLLDHASQARARCSGTEMNRGTEAARTAVATLQTLQEARQA